MVEFVGTELAGVEPDGALGGLAHFGPRGRRQEGEGQGLGRPAFDPADEVNSGQDVPPLVVAAHLQGAAVLPVERQIVVGLEELVVELDEGQSLFQAQPIGLGGQHAVDAEMPADIAEEFDVFQGQEPVGVVDRDGPGAVEVEVAGELDEDGLALGPDGRLLEHLAHLGLAAGVADHGRPAADDGDGPVAGPPEMDHGHDGDEAPGVEARGRAVEADVEGDGVRAEHLADGVLVRDLGDEAARLELIVRVAVHDRPLGFLYHRTRAPSIRGRPEPRLRAVFRRHPLEPQSRPRFLSRGPIFGSRPRKRL